MGNAAYPHRKVVAERPDFWFECDWWVAAGTVIKGPSWNTDQGAQGVCESLGLKPKGEIKVKSVIIVKFLQQSPACLFIGVSAVKHAS